MPDITIPALPSFTDVDNNSLFIVDSGTQTFKVTGANLAAYIRETVLPAGITAPFAGSVEPTGWLFCYGQAVSRSTYSKLFTAIGTTFGIGDGSTTFNLPDCRGRVIAGKDNMGGSAASRLTVGVSGITGTTLGAAGGGESYTPAGTNGGSQSIAHTHTGPSHTHTMAHTHTGPSHTHGIAHVHAWLRAVDGGATYQGYSLINANSATASISTSVTGDTGQAFSESNAFTTGAGNTPIGMSNFQRYYYTTGVLDGPSGTGSSAVSGAGGTGNTGAASSSTTSSSGTGATGAMSTNNTVNGSNFTFTGTAGHRVQPTIVMNTIIKT